MNEEKDHKNLQSFIVVTGAAGFIGSCMVSYLNQQGFENLILVDEFDDEEKELNLLHSLALQRLCTLI